MVVLLVGEVPRGGGAADGLAGEVVEDGRGQVDGVAIAAHALVDDGGSGGLAGALAGDGDGTSAVGVAVGLLTHERVRECNDVIAIAGGDTARAEPSVVVGDVSSAGATLRALSARAGATSGAWWRGRRSSGRRGRRLWRGRDGGGRGREGSLSWRRRRRRVGSVSGGRACGRRRGRRGAGGRDDDGGSSDGLGGLGLGLEELRRAVGGLGGLRVRVGGRHGDLGAGRDPVGGGEAYDLGDIVDVGDPDDVVLALVVVTGVLVLVGEGSRGQEGSSKDCGLHDDDDDRGDSGDEDGVEPVYLILEMAVIAVLMVLLDCIQEAL